MAAVLFSDDDYLDPADFEEAYREVYELDDGEPIDRDALYCFMGEERDMNLSDEISNIDSRIGALIPAGGALMVHGASSHWNGVSHGYGELYGSVAEIMGDTGYDGMFKDCQSFSISDDQGDLHITGIHHDGRVEMDVRALTPDLKAAFERAVEESETDQEVATALGKVWDSAVKPDMTRYYGCPAESQAERETAGCDLNVESHDAREASASMTSPQEAERRAEQAR